MMNRRIVNNGVQKPWCNMGYIYDTSLTSGSQGSASAGCRLTTGIIIAVVHSSVPAGLPLKFGIMLVLHNNVSIALNVQQI